MLPEEAVALLQAGDVVLGGGERFPLMAYELAIDTVQLEKDRELIVTSSAAMRAGSSLTACTSLDTRSGWNASRSCACVGDGELTLNCDHAPYTPRRAMPAVVKSSRRRIHFRTGISGVATTLRIPFRMATERLDWHRFQWSHSVWQQLAWTQCNLSWSSSDVDKLDSGWTWVVPQGASDTLQTLLEETWNGRWPVDN